MPARTAYDVVVVGGGPAGMTTALYTTRLGHPTAVFEREGGRHARVSEVHNLYGVSEAVDGSELARHAVDQLQEYGGDYHVDPVSDVHRVGDSDRPGGTDRDEDGGSEIGGEEDGGADHVGDEDGLDSAGGKENGIGSAGGDGEPRGREDVEFVVESTHATVGAKRVVFATGFTDVEPGVPELQRFAGRGLHYCLHCDAYTLGDSRVFVLGHDDHAASVAMLLLNVTDDVDLLLNDATPSWNEETDGQLAAHPVDVVGCEVEDAFPRDPSADAPRLGGLRFADGTERRYRGGFAMYGSDYNTDLAESLGCALTDEGTIDVDEDQATSVAGAYAVGDVTHGQNQTVFALADGAQAGLAIHKELREFPRAATGEPVDEADVPAAPPALRARMRLFREREARAGLQSPSPRQ